MPLADVTLRYLEMVSPTGLRPKRVARGDVVFGRVDPPVPALNRYFYLTIGGDWFWLERRPWTRAQWSAWAIRPEVETHVLSVGGVPAGYCELERLAEGAIEIKYFGLGSTFVGQGLGAHLLTEAVERAWAMGASRVLLNTCNLDHPKALENYLARGFREYRTEVQRKEVPLVPPGPWDDAARP
jgi:GNAT superfamily N-acetyltransferase